MTKRQRRIVYTALGFVALVGSMELSRTPPPAVKTEPAHGLTAAEQPAVTTLKTEPAHGLTAAEQCAMVANPIQDCVAVLSGKLAQAPYSDMSKTSSSEYRTDEQKAADFAFTMRVMGQRMSIEDMGKCSRTHPNGEWEPAPD
jgi:hypothetical protein